MFPTKNAIQYLINKQEYICSMCFNYSIDLLQCPGSCRKFICFECIDRNYSNSYNCQYCSDGYFYHWFKAEQKKVEFFCPYTLNDHVSLHSFKEFEKHCFSCPQMSQKDRFLVNCINNYQCVKGHKLLFLSLNLASEIFNHNNIFTQRTFLNTLTQFECQICKERNLTRSYCRECSDSEERHIVYCIRCFALPVTKQKCPIGHKLKRKAYRSANSVCDYCGFLDVLAKDKSYYDSACILNICNICFERLPEENSFMTLENENKERQNEEHGGQQLNIDLLKNNQK